MTELYLTVDETTVAYEQLWADMSQGFVGVTDEALYNDYSRLILGHQDMWTVIRAAHKELERRGTITAYHQAGEGEPE